MPLLPYLELGAGTRPTPRAPQAAGQGAAAFASALQDVSNASLFIADTELRSRARLASVRAENDLRQAVLDVQDANDPDTAEETLQARAKEIGAKYADELPGRYAQDFSTQFEDAASRSQIAVRGWVRELRVSATRAQTDEAVDAYQRFAADAPTREETESQRAKALAAITEAEGAGVFTAEEAQKRREEFDRGLARANVREAIRLDPAGAFTALSQNRFEGLGAEEKQAWMANAQAEHEQQVRDQQSRNNQARIENDRVRKLRAEEISKDLLDLAGPGGRGVTMADLAGIREFGTDTEYGAWVARVEAGGKLEPAGGRQTDPATYSGLYDGAASGDPGAVENIRVATVSGLITPAQHDTLLKVSTDTRFKDARLAISSAFPIDRLTQGFAAMNAKLYGKIDPTIGVAARRDFEDWVASSETATRDEARQKADQIIRDYRNAEIDSQGRAIPTLGTLPQRPEKPVEIDEALVEVRKRVAERYEIPENLLSPDLLRSDPYFKEQAFLAQRWRDWLQAQETTAKAAP
jgi:hypothetical protein